MKKVNQKFSNNNNKFKPNNNRMKFLNYSNKLMMMNLYKKKTKKRFTSRNKKLIIC